MTVFYCSKCGATLTPDLTALPAVPTVPGIEDARPEGAQQAPPTVPRVCYAIETEPWGAPFVVQEDQENPAPSQPRGILMATEEGFVASAGGRDTIVVHPDDAPALRPLPNGENSSGCCGPNGTEGLNRACPCGARVATLAADCFGPYELHLDPVRTYAFTPQVEEVPAGT
ncbi:hypothetical protein ACGF13_39400 [Kitasatospora sp. NPDC048286]|uniref:hypothetical protein n=1 Tax=Kitasatospora sp. NPDC048286 TaxID=3364047 RepID=UPI00371FBB4A